MLFQIRIDGEHYTGSWEDDIDLNAESLDAIFNEVTAATSGPGHLVYPKFDVVSMPCIVELIEDNYGSQDVLDFEHDIEIKSFQHEVLKLTFSTTIRYNENAGALANDIVTKSGTITIMEQV